MRYTSSQGGREGVCVQRNRCSRFIYSGIVQVPLRPFPPPLSPPGIRVRGLCQLRMVEQRCVQCAKGILQ